MNQPMTVILLPKRTRSNLLISTSLAGSLPKSIGRTISFA